MRLCLRVVSGAAARTVNKEYEGFGPLAPCLIVNKGDNQQAMHHMRVLVRTEGSWELGNGANPDLTAYPGQLASQRVRTSA